MFGGRETNVEFPNRRRESQKPRKKILLAFSTSPSTDILDLQLKLLFSSSAVSALTYRGKEDGSQRWGHLALIMPFHLRLVWHLHSFLLTT